MPSLFIEMPFLKDWVKDADGVKRDNPLSWLSKRKILDNLRRCMLPASVLYAVLLMPLGGGWHIALALFALCDGFFTELITLPFRQRYPQCQVLQVERSRIGLTLAIHYVTTSFSYVLLLVKMVMNDDTWYVVRNTRGCTGFVGPASKPVPLSAEEVEKMGVEKAAPLAVDFNVGDTVQITAGPLEGFMGLVEEIDTENFKVKLKVNMFGRETPAEVEIGQVELP